MQVEHKNGRSSEVLRLRCESVSKSATKWERANVFHLLPSSSSMCSTQASTWTTKVHHAASCLHEHVAQQQVYLQPRYMCLRKPARGDGNMLRHHLTPYLTSILHKSALLKTWLTAMHALLCFNNNTVTHKSVFLNSYHNYCFPMMPFVCIYCITIDMTSVTLSISVCSTVYWNTYVNVPLIELADDIRWTQRKERRQ